MSLFQRLLAVGFLPVIAFICLQIWNPEAAQILRDYVSPYLAPYISSLAPIPRSDIQIVIACHAAWSHIEKMAAVTSALIALGYPVTFLTAPEFKSTISDLGATFVPVDGSDRMMSEELMQEWFTIPSGLENELFALRHVMIASIPNMHNSLQRVFKSFPKKNGVEKPLVFLYDSSWQGLTPVQLGAPGLLPDATIGIGMAALAVDSNDTYPFRSGLPPDTSPNAKEIHFKALQEQNQEWFYKTLHEIWSAKLAEMGAKGPSFPGFFHAIHAMPEYLLQIGVPEFEFPRSDLRPNVKYFGGLGKVGSADQRIPAWWDDVLSAKKAGKKIVAVSQGSVDANPDEVIFPTIEALKDRDDVLVIATLVVADPDKDVKIPDNTRMARFVPYDLLLPMVSVLVSNGGYGAVQQAIRFGVPMVVSGLGQDKAQTNSIIDWVGVGIDLRARSPPVEAMKEAVGKVLEDPKYTEKAVWISKKFDNYDMKKVVDETVQEAVRRKTGK